MTTTTFTTDQEIFDRVATHLLAQRRKSVKFSTVNGKKYRYCQYRSPQGLSCAVGCLITDGAYSDYIENRPADDDDVIKLLNESGVFVNDTNLLSSLQALHDNTHPNGWRKGSRPCAGNGPETEDVQMSTLLHWCRHCARYCADSAHRCRT